MGQIPDKQMETGARGYLLVGKAEFLEPFNQGKKSFYELIESLSGTVDDNPVQVQTSKETRTTIDDWLENAVQPAIALREEVGASITMDDMAALIGEAKGKIYFDKFRGQIATFVERERQLMAVRNADADKTADRTLKTLLAGTALTVLLTLIIAYLLGHVITKPLNLLVNNLRDIAEGEGNLTARLAAGGKDEIGQTAKYFNLFVANIGPVRLRQPTKRL